MEPLPGTTLATRLLPLPAAPVTMDEHLGVTSHVAASILAKSTLVPLLHGRATRVGTAQRLQNILALYPRMVEASAHRQRVFEVADAAMRIIAQWTEDAWRRIAAHQQQPQPQQQADCSAEGASSDATSHASGMATEHTSDSIVSHLYVLALMHQILALRSAFTPKQVRQMDAWAAALALASRGIDLDAITPTLRAHFLAYDPFRAMRAADADTDTGAGTGTMASFRIPGVKPAHVHAKKHQPTKPISSVAAVVAAAGGHAMETAEAAPSSAPSSSGRASPDDIPFSFLPRTVCPQCGRSQPFYCTHCYIVLHPAAEGKLPRVHLPLAIDIILHANVLRHKSTALQCLLLGQPRSQVRVHTFPAIPLLSSTAGMPAATATTAATPPRAGDAYAYAPATTAVVFPSERALTIAELARRMTTTPHRSGIDANQSTANGPPLATAGAEAVATTATPPLASLQRVIFLEGTWDEAETMLQHPSLRHLTHLRLDFASPSADHSEAATAAASASSASSDSVAVASSPAAPAPPPTTAFWRYQRFGAGFLSSIEAIYHTLQQYHPYRAQLTPPPKEEEDAPPAAGGTTGASYDNLLWLFAMSYDRVRAYYRSHSRLLPPPVHGGAIEG